MKHTKSPEDTIIASIKASREQVLVKQDALRAKLDEPSIDKSTAELNVSSLDWETFKEQLDNCYYPIDQEWINKYLVNPKQFRSKTEIRIKKIENLDIQYDLYFLNLDNQQLLRLHVITLLQQQFGALDDYALIASHWIRYSQCVLISKEINDKSELAAKGNGLTTLEIDAVVSKIIIAALLGLELPAGDPSILESMP
tara:strand:- start:198 stop:791 length:594 start_codon:yes stop_codon:yes gene_type:complete